VIRSSSDFNPREEDLYQADPEFNYLPIPYLSTNRLTNSSPKFSFHERTNSLPSTAIWVLTLADLRATLVW